MQDVVTVGTRVVPANFGPMKGAGCHARFNGPCGDTMEVWLRFYEGRVAQATFTTDGCAHSMLAGSTAVALALGRTPAELDQLDEETVHRATGGLPHDHVHCARLALKTLKLAVANRQDHTIAAGCAAPAADGIQTEE